MSVFDRLGYSFDSTRFGDASILSSNASNTLNLIASTSPPMKDWQIQDLSAGTSATRSNYFQNRTTTYNSSMLVSVNSLAVSANAANDSVTVAAASSLIVKLNTFQSHTDNISGVSVVTSYQVPSYDSLSILGQQNMMNLTKTDGPQSNTVPMLGGFTSLFIQDKLSAYANQLSTYANTYSNTYSTTYSTYMNGVGTDLNARITADWTFYQNSLAVSNESAFLQQLTSAGGTNTYLLNNVIGTPSLVTKLNS